MMQLTADNVGLSRELTAQIGLQPGADGRARVVLTTQADDGEDLVYPFELVGAAATPAA